MNENTVVFTITKDGKGFNITSKKANRYNCYCVSQERLFDELSELADIFNNTYNIGVLFEIE